MAEFPADFVPSDQEVPEGAAGSGGMLGKNDMTKLLAQDSVRSWLEQLTEQCPTGLRRTFLACGSAIAQIVNVGNAPASPFADLFGGGIPDPRILELMSALHEIHKSAKETGDDQSEDPLGFEQALLTTIRQHSLLRRTAVGSTLTTLLGKDALLWLTAPSAEGVGKIQLHEFSRTGWHKLWDIDNQISIERELLDWPADLAYLAKVVVGLSWTMAALASFMPPAIFLGEITPHLSSERRGQYTVSSGRGTHTLLSFQSSSMLRMVKILSEGIMNPLLTAADLMWMAASLAEVREIRSGTGSPGTVKTEQRFAVFLSHRGRDAKRRLSSAVQDLEGRPGIFLDCMVMPRGVINRCFIYSSLSKSDRILIVETENFSESEWCRKEAWFSDAMAAHGQAKVERTTLADAEMMLGQYESAAARGRHDESLRYPIAPRVMRDIDYWARTPNLFSLKEKGFATTNLVELQAILGQAETLEDPAWVLNLGRTVSESLSRVFASAPDAEPFDLWSTALQLAMAAFACTSNARSKMEVRRGVDQLNAALQAIVGSKLHQSPLFRAQGPAHLALLAAASAISVAGLELDRRMLPALQLALQGTALIRDGLLLLDMRRPGPERSSRLELIAALVQNGLGSVGIIQDAADQVHRERIGAMPLEVLPCVTLYPGMESLLSDTL